MVTNMEAKG